MTHLDPILMQALHAAMPTEYWALLDKQVKEETERLSKLDRGILQKVIESLITKLHPDGIEASEILAALTVAVKRRYDNQLVTEAKIDDYAASLSKTFERAYKAA